MTTPTSRTGAFQVPTTGTAFVNFAEAIRKTAHQIQDAAGDTAPALRVGLPAVIVARAKGAVDSGEASRQARSIARDFTLIAMLMRTAARLAVRAQAKYARDVRDAPQKVARAGSKFDADA